MSPQRPRPNNAVARIAGLTIVNAMMFQEVLADYEPQVQHLRQTLASPDAISSFAEHWGYVLSEINYHPIFHVAHQLLLALPSNPDSHGAVRALAKTALEIVQQRAALRHDLMGRIYHRLLAEAKYLGAFYTSVPAATLLLKVALNPQRWHIDWGDLGKLSLVSIGDLACGTGTLLMAAAEAVTDNYLASCGQTGTVPKLDILSRLLMEDMIYGYDVQLSALHLTASTLALRSPEVTFRLMHLWVLPLGGPHGRLGSIEFLRGFSVPVTADLFGASMGPGQVTRTAGVKQREASLPDLDLCVMNPPFTSSRQPNLLFGSLPDDQRRLMQRELAKLVRSPRVHASTTAGLGSVFVATADLHLKTGGRMALVLPKALLSGVAWAKTRGLLGQRYRLEYLIVSQDPRRWNFSENTELSEVLLVAQKLDWSKPQNTDSSNVVCVNLWKNPSTAVEAVGIAHSLAHSDPPDIEEGQGAFELLSADVKFGEAVSVPWPSIRNGLWMTGCAFAQSDLLRAAHHLAKGELYLPGIGMAGSAPLCPLGQLATLGPDPRDVYDAFQLAKGKTSYPALWGHQASSVTTMAQVPNAYLSPLHRARERRHLRRATDLWPKAGRLLLSQRPWLNTKRLAAVLLNQPVLADVWCPILMREGTEHSDKVLAVWFNCTLGLTALWARREETRGAWVQFKKPVLSAMPVVDVGALSATQRQELADAYDRLCQQPLLPFPQMACDPVRAAIDTAVAQALGLPDFGILRDLLAREPIVCLQPLS